MKSKNSRTESKGILDDIIKVIPRFFLLVALLILIVFFTCLTPSFIRISNLMNILRTASAFGMLGLGFTMVQATGDMNFTFSAQAAMGAVLTGIFMLHMPYWISVFLAVLICTISGLAPAFIVIRLKVPAFITTMGFMTIYTGVLKVLTNNTILYKIEWGDRYTALARGEIAGIPYPVIIFVIAAAAVHLFFERSKTGRYLFAIGASKTTCKQVGINEAKIRYIGYLLCSALAALGGIMYASSLGQASPLLGNDLTLPTIAITMLCATFYQTGRYNVPGIIVASIIMIVVQNGVMGLGMEAWVKDIAVGLMLIIAVSFIAKTHKKGLPTVTFGS